MKQKPNLLLLGAAGAQSHALLFYLKNHRSLFGRLVLSDQYEFHNDAFETLTELHAEYMRHRIDQKDSLGFVALLEKADPDIVLDLSDAPTEFVAGSVFDLGKASYINTAYCSSDPLPLGEALNHWIDALKDRTFSHPHILFSGMNPGVVNVWAAIGARKFGIPKEITEFEYDTSRFMSFHEEKMVTWCVREFIDELVTDPAEVMLGDHRIRSMYPNGLFHRKDLGHLFEPILKLQDYPAGCIVMHEECVTLGNRWNIPVQFLYTVNQETMRHVKRLYEEKGKLEDSDLVLARNLDDPLTGADNIAMRLDYDDKAVYYLNSAANENLKECSGTVFQVVVGVMAALFTLLHENLEARIYYTEDLLDTFLSKFITDNMMIQEYVFKKDDKGHLELLSHNPHISAGQGVFVKV